MPIQGLNFTIPASAERHQSYQATGSFVVYNANDGIAYIATDRTATPLSWDYKVPSQSGGRFPGPINSYLSIFYLDQSGGGSTGEVVVYASTEQVNIPYFWSIGRAATSLGTSLDIASGNQPGNPPAGFGRLWIDSGGHLNILQPGGSNYVVVDSTTPLGGYLRGTVSNAIISVPNNNWVFAKDSGAVERNWILPSSDNNTYIQSLSPTAGIIFRTSAAVVLASLVNPGALTITQNLMIGGGICYFANNAGINITWNGAQFATTHAIVNGANVYYFATTAIYLSWNGTQINTSHAVNIAAANNSAGAYLSVPARLGPQICLYDQGGGNIYGIGINSGELVLMAGASAQVVARTNTYNGALAPFQCATATVTHLTGPNDAAAPMQSWILGTSSAGSGNVYCPATSIPSLRSGKSDLQIMADTECLVRVLDNSVHAWTFMSTPTEPKARNTTEEVSDWPVLHTANGRAVGFVVDEIIEVVPEVVSTADGEAFGLTYQLLTAILWGAIRELNRKVDTLAGTAA